MRLLLLLCLLSTQAMAETDFSKTIEYVQKTYADNFTKYPILIFDLDELELRYAKAKAFGKGKEKERERAAIIKQYVFEKKGVELEDNESMTYETYTAILKEGAYALPLLQRIGSNRNTYKMCAVFPASPNSNQRLETERITGLKTPGAYEDVTYTGIQEKLTYDQMQLFSLYHELGHCLDQTFMPENYNTYEPGAHGVHQSESFAEVFALLLLEREGFKGTARTRALLRNMYTQKMGKWFIDNPQNGFGNPMYLKGGLIYYLAPSLLAADEFLKRNRNFVQSDISLLLEKAAQIVNEHSIPFRSFSAIHRSMNEEQEKVITFYREFADDSPGFFMQAYKDLLTFIDFSPYLLEQIVGNTPDVNTGESLEALDAVDYCALNMVDDDAVVQYLQVKRSELRESSLDYEDSNQRKEELNKFFELFSNCP